MSMTRWFLYASFTGGIIALSLQPNGIANASTILVTDQSSSSNQDTQRDSHSGKKGMSDAESTLSLKSTVGTSGKMQSDKDAKPGSEQMGSKIIDQVQHEQDTSQGSSPQDSSRGGSSGSSATPESSNMGGGSGLSGSGTGSGTR